MQSLRFKSFLYLQPQIAAVRSFHLQATPIPETPIDLGYIDQVLSEDQFDCKGRNSRKPKKANHGARPCSSYMRKLKQKGWYHIIKE